MDKPEVVLRNPNELKEYEKNPKDHPQEQIDKIAVSITKFGFRVPILITEDDVIVAGHGRNRAAKQLGLKQVPCLVATGMSEEEIKAFRIADNKLAKTEWDLEFLKSELGDLAGVDFDMSTLGFNQEELGFFINLEKGNANDPNAEWKGMPGFQNEDREPLRTILIHFMSEKDVEDFAKLLNQNITEKTKYLYYPKLERDAVEHLRYEHEP